MPGGEIAGSLLLATVITKIVDLLRKADTKDTWWKGTWIVAAIVLGVVIALAFKINVLAELGLEPENELQGAVGQFITGIVVGALSSVWHEWLDALSSLAKLGRARAAAEPLTIAGLRAVWGATIPEDAEKVDKLRDDQAILREAQAMASQVHVDGGAAPVGRRGG